MNKENIGVKITSCMKTTLGSIQHRTVRNTFFLLISLGKISDIYKYNTKKKKKNLFE